MFKYFILSALYAVSISVYALGMQPETTVLVLNQDEGEASISVKNTNDVPSLLQTKVIDVDGAKGTVVLASPAIVKVDSGEEQVVRFFLKTNGELKTQQLKRVKFLGLPARNKESADDSAVNVSVSQSIPLIINPTGMKHESEPWKFLDYRYGNGKIYISNPSPYVVRMYPYADINGSVVDLPKPFISPRETIEINFKNPPSVIKIKPVGLYGEVRDEYKIDQSKK
ncbi:hypothetical protein BK340_26595 [Escherichia coli]|uniref:fimbria/pilus chaperone family protein n=1 Tax=Escherichia coli TaxID=562 RepID=UPI00092B7552|nr:fimbria/pilus chaperone family protein [Escherichia coli]MCV5645647.1 fimbria/pilus chaperone family protein [Escherichia coli]OJM61131.1 hypothetical protein BK284_17735 [Escherichia coli]OJO97277.1 hypothetical protein BK331_17545 [Escherichia coli]OJP36595.1 hypothetical protein BK340_26595 [Escherichia coli]HCK0775332.1 fimbria/pilus periplasmic chaperone [Escherichia coli]